MPDYHIPLIPGQQYHVFNRAIGDEKMFRDKSDYPFFLQRYQKHVLSVADTYCYCLLPNHFHFMVKIKDETSIKKHFLEVKNKPFHCELISDFIMERFSNFCNSYTKSINKVYKRKGSLFINFLRRVKIETPSQFKRATFYIHNNPVNHGYLTKIDKWPWSSYNSIFSDKPTFLLREEVLKIFGGKQGFIQYHNRKGKVEYC
ncbi:MAG: hypothetical protein ABI480_03155 [Chitinophagaceae bacterium]